MDILRIVLEMIEKGVEKEFIFAFEEQLKKFIASDQQQQTDRLKQLIQKQKLTAEQKGLLAQYLQIMVAQIALIKKNQPQVAKTLATSVIAGPVGIFGIQGALNALGFAMNPPIAANIAPLIQANGLFALAQNMGAVGAFVGPAGILAGIGVALGAGTGFSIYQKIKGNKKIQQKIKQIQGLIKWLQS